MINRICHLVMRMNRTPQVGVVCQVDPTDLMLKNLMISSHSLDWCFHCIVVSDETPSPKKKGRPTSSGDDTGEVDLGTINASHTKKGKRSPKDSLPYSKARDDGNLESYQKRLKYVQFQCSYIAHKFTITSSTCFEITCKLYHLGD